MPSGASASWSCGSKTCPAPSKSRAAWRPKRSRPAFTTRPKRWSSSRATWRTRPGTRPTSPSSSRGRWRGPSRRLGAVDDLAQHRLAQLRAPGDELLGAELAQEGVHHLEVLEGLVVGELLDLGAGQRPRLEDQLGVGLGALHGLILR